MIITKRLHIGIFYVIWIVFFGMMATWTENEIAKFILVVFWSHLVVPTIYILAQYVAYSLTTVYDLEYYVSLTLARVEIRNSDGRVTSPHLSPKAIGVLVVIAVSILMTPIYWPISLGFISTMIWAILGDNIYVNRLDRFRMPYFPIDPVMKER